MQRTITRKFTIHGKRWSQCTGESNFAEKGPVSAYGNEGEKKKKDKTLIERARKSS